MDDLPLAVRSVVARIACHTILSPGMSTDVPPQVSIRIPTVRRQSNSLELFQDSCHTSSIANLSPLLNRRSDQRRSYENWCQTGQSTRFHPHIASSFTSNHFYICRMLSALSSITAQPAKDRLPRELDVLVHDMSAYCPTHMLAVYSMTSPNARAHKVTLYPAHHAVLAAYCKNLPRLPPPNPARNHISATQTISLPVVPLCLPCPDTFPLLQSYFYTRRVDALLAALLPIAPAMSESGGQPLSDILGQLARRLSMECTTEKLLGYSITIRGLWRNVCALGVDDEALWRAMDMAWNVVLAAISIISARS